MTRSAAAPDPRPPGGVALALRPLGYLMVSLVWSAIGALVLALGYGMLPLLALSSVVWDVPIETWELLAAASTLERYVAMPLFVVVGGVVFGSGALGALSFAAFSLIALSWTAFIRSLRPSFRGDALTYTMWADRGSTFGFTATSVALSLIPTYESRFTRWVMRFYVYGWQPGLRMLLGMVPAGSALILLVGVGVDSSAPAAVRWPLTVLAVALALWSVIMVRRDWRARFGPSERRGTTSGTPVTKLSPEERSERLEELRSRRERRAAAARRRDE
ncbi:hypothetical protein [Georgenia sp. SUBG003]|uniref:hypothetical protein n=1 Tax=Georgenia sp. SUBG003 TaxID=1497974 RepID=UPI003AB4DFB5